MLQILCSSVRVKLLARAKLRFLREQPDDFFFCGDPDNGVVLTGQRSVTIMVLKLSDAIIHVRHSVT